MFEIKIIIFLAILCINISTGKSFIFSVIISIYNTGRYLDDSIGSVVNQTVNLKNIQIILVNDGSTDETEEKCLKYKEKYPKNIIYIKTVHGGVSKARNIGIKYAKGEFINFFDSDDKWEKNAFSYVLLFFRYYKKLNIIGCRIKCFEASEGYHPLDYKFYRTRVVNLTEEYNCVHLSSASSFFRYSFIKDKQFKEGVFNSEDTRLLNNIFLINPLLGIIRESVYFYRKRADFTSAVQNSNKKEEYYFSIINLVNEYLIEKSKKLYNKILPFLQFYLSYDILFRIAFPAFRYLKKNKLNKYYEIIHKILYQIEDKYIIEQKILTLKEKVVALSKKYNHDLRDDIVIKNGLLLYYGNILINIKKYPEIINWRILDIKNGIIHLEGKDNCFLKRDNYFYYCKLGNKIIYPEYYYYSLYNFVTMYGTMDKGRMVVFNIPINDNIFQILKFFLVYKDSEVEIFPSLGWFTHIPNMNEGYYYSSRYIIKFKNGRLNIFPYNETLIETFEDQYCKILRKLLKTDIIKIRRNFFLYKKNNANNKNLTWLINDKQNLAGDNGEYFFRFLKNKKPNTINFFFVIKKDCLDYKRLQPLGNILDLGSEDYLNIFLSSDKIISSVSESWVDNPFGNNRNYLRDLFHFEFIFIQHGILKDNLSRQLNRISKNFNLIITSSNKEYKSIFDFKYYYNFNNVVLTGLPRYDNLQKLQPVINKEKIILIIPTWRFYIKGTFDLNTYESKYYPSFNLTNYFNFYNNLINDGQLLMNMKILNYKGIFCLHPSFSEQWKDFNQNEIFLVLKVCDYQNLILKSSLLITDYSSIFFDFAYLKKPIIYTHFDYREYINKHYPKGYFDYLKHGFGRICFDKRCTINEIILKMKNNCSVEKKYLKRIKAFFKFSDEQNCERLYINLLNNTNSIINEKNNYYHQFINIFILLFILIKINFYIKVNC